MLLTCWLQIGEYSTKFTIYLFLFVSLAQIKNIKTGIITWTVNNERASGEKWFMQYIFMKVIWKKKKSILSYNITVFTTTSQIQLYITWNSLLKLCESDWSTESSKGWGLTLHIFIPCICQSIHLGSVFLSHTHNT